MTDDCVKRSQARQSIRRYMAESIPEEILVAILKTGFSAPSTGNRQPWRVVQVTAKELKERLTIAAGGQTFLSRAPVVFVVCAVPQESAERHGERGFTLYAFQDTAALTQNLLIAIHLLGYASCWISAFDEKQVIEVLNIPQGIRPVSIIPVGKLEGKLPSKPERRDMHEIIISETF